MNLFLAGTASVEKVHYEPGPAPVMSPLDAVLRVLPALTDARGALTPWRATARLFDTMELRTRVTPPKVISLLEMEDPEPNPALKALAPALIFRGPAGTLTVAPYGEVPDGTRAFYVGIAGVLGGAALLATGATLLGYQLGKKKRRRARG